MHDDQHGTAVVTLAAVITAGAECRRRFEECRRRADRTGSCGDRHLPDVDGLRGETGHRCRQVGTKAKERLSSIGGETVDGLDELMDRVDIVVATTGVPGLIREEWVRKGQVILALSNPRPEIEPDVARRAGAAYAADGRSVPTIFSASRDFSGGTQRPRQNNHQTDVGGGCDIDRRMHEGGGFGTSSSRSSSASGGGESCGKTCVKKSTGGSSSGAFYLNPSPYAGRGTLLL